MITHRTMHVALLRGINVGKAKRIAMADLRALFERLGYGDVKTLLNSGNVVFSTPRANAKSAPTIQKEILARLGVSSRVVVLTALELDEIVSENPFAEGERNPSRFLVAVLASTGDRARIAGLAERDWGSERLGVGSRAAYLWCPNGILESPAALALGKLLGDGVTSRNWATMQKLQALATAATAPRR